MNDIPGCDDDAESSSRAIDRSGVTDVRIAVAGSSLVKVELTLDLTTEPVHATAVPQWAILPSSADRRYSLRDAGASLLHFSNAATQFGVGLASASQVVMSPSGQELLAIGGVSAGLVLLSGMAMNVYRLCRRRRR